MMFRVVGYYSPVVFFLRHAHMVVSVPPVLLGFDACGSYNEQC